MVAAFSTPELWNSLAIDMVPLLQEAGEASAIAALKQIDITGVFDAVNQDAVEYARERAGEMVGKRLVNGILIENPAAKWRIDDPTRQWIKEAVTAAFEEGMSPAELGKFLQDDYAFSKQRAKMIAFTEVGNINVRTHAVAAEKSGATHKRSQLSADHDQDDFCDAAAAAGEVEFDHDYGMGLKHPLYHPRCQCSMTFYVRKKKAA